LAKSIAYYSRLGTQRFLSDRLLGITILQVLIVIVLPLARLQWTALGYAAAMALNVAGQFLVYNVVLDAKQVVIGGITYYTPYIEGRTRFSWLRGDYEVVTTWLRKS
jgi:hypothetical protein